MDLTRKPMAGYLCVDEPALASDQALHFWVKRCLDFVVTLLRKEQK
jgi:hypothetical protein